jgi:hypothetical protein
VEDGATGVARGTEADGSDGRVPRSVGDSAVSSGLTRQTSHPDPLVGKAARRRLPQAPGLIVNFSWVEADFTGRRSNLPEDLVHSGNDARPALPHAFVGLSAEWRIEIETSLFE